MAGKMVVKMVGMMVVWMVELMAVLMDHQWGASKVESMVAL